MTKTTAFSRSMSDSDKENIVKCHNENLRYALDNMNEFDMIVLDEIFASYNYDLVDKANVRNIVENYGGELVMTAEILMNGFVKELIIFLKLKR